MSGKSGGMEDKRGQKGKGGGEGRQVKRGNEDQEPNNANIKQPKFNFGNNAFAPLGDQMDIEQIDSSDEAVLSGNEAESRKEDPTRRKEDPTRRKEDTSRNGEPTSAKTDLEKNKNLSNIKQILLTSTNNDQRLTTYNPEKIGEAIEEYCGEIEKTDYQTSGSILVTIKHPDQIEKLQACTELPILNIPVKANIAWTTHFTYGKLWAPEFMRDSLQEILQIFEKHGVVAVRKLYNDTKRANQPIYVFTFLGPIPENITIGRGKEYKFEKYYPSPLQCRNCWRLCHMTKLCRSQTLCSKCTSPDHLRDQCDADKLHCINCKGEHEATNRKCPRYLREVEICKITAEYGVSFSKAREIQEESERRQWSQELDSYRDIDLQSTTEFPRLRQKSSQRQPPTSQPSALQPTASQPSTSQYQRLSQNNNKEKSSPFAKVIKKVLGKPTALADPVWKTQTTRTQETLEIPEPTQEQSLLDNITQNLPEIISYAIKIALAKTISDKMQHIIAIGRILGLEEAIVEIIESITNPNSSDGARAV